MFILEAITTYMSFCWHR